MLLLLEYYLWWEFRQYWSILRGLRAQNLLRKGYFMDAESIHKTLKALNLRTTNAILMKLTAIMYLHWSINGKPLRSKNPVFWSNVNEFLDYIKIRHKCHTLLCAASPEKFFAQISWKTAQNRSKMIATLTFKGL